MYKLGLLLLATLAIAQDLDSIMLDIYGPDVNSNTIYTNSGEVTTGGASTKYAPPVPAQYRFRRQTFEGESCTFGSLEGRCVPYYQCNGIQNDKRVDLTQSIHACDTSIELCCPLPQN